MEKGIVIDSETSNFIDEKEVEGERIWGEKTHLVSDILIFRCLEDIWIKLSSWICKSEAWDKNLGQRWDSGVTGISMTIDITRMDWINQVGECAEWEKVFA